MRTPTAEIYEDAGGEFRWRLRARNGKVIADSAEGYVSRRNATRAWFAVARSLRAVVVVRHLHRRKAA